MNIRELDQCLRLAYDAEYERCFKLLIPMLKEMDMRIAVLNDKNEQLTQEIRKLKNGT